jgi:hypothetical protein
VAANTALCSFALAPIASVLLVHDANRRVLGSSGSLKSGHNVTLIYLGTEPNERRRLGTTSRSTDAAQLYGVGPHCRS